MNATKYLDYLKSEFCRHYKLTSEYIEEVYRQAGEPGQDELSAYWRAYERLKKETRGK